MLDTQALEAFITQQVSCLQKTNAKLLEEDQIDSWGYKRGTAAPEVASKFQIYYFINIGAVLCHNVFSSFLFNSSQSCYYT